MRIIDQVCWSVANLELFPEVSGRSAIQRRKRILDFRLSATTN